VSDVAVTPAASGSEPRLAGPVEVPVYIPTRGERIGAVVTLPVDPSADLGVLMMSGRARDRAHRNGMWVRTAEAVAAAGAYAVRLDYPGVGNSTGSPAVFPLEQTPAWAVQDACRFLIEHTPVTRVVLVGTCFGARVMLDAAPGVDEVAGVAYICGPVLARTPSWRFRIARRARRLLRRSHPDGTAAADPGKAAGNAAQQAREGNLVAERRVSPAFKRSLERTLRKVKTYFLMGSEDFVYDELQFALETIQPPKDRYELDVVPGVLHTFQTLEDQQLIVEWVPRLVSRLL
jgi:pimeloyl-ACP methyl ester carboxylesterase